jgi:hypothetical protein
MKLVQLVFSLSLLKTTCILAQEKRDLYPFANYLIDYGGCIGTDSLAFQSIGNDLFQDSKNNLYYLCYDETEQLKTPLFIKRFRSNCDGEVLASDSIYDLGKTIDLPTFQKLGDGYYKDFSNKYFFESRFDGGEFRIVYNDLRTYTQLEYPFYRGDDGKLYIMTQNLISPPENYGPVFYRQVPDIDVQTYQEFNASSDYKKDKNCIYWKYGTTDGTFIQLVKADLETFQVIQFGLGKDKKHVFFQGKIVEGLDPKSVKTYKDYTTFLANRKKHK